MLIAPGVEEVIVPVKTAVEELLGRASGPMHARLVMQPVMAGILAIRAGLKDAREGNPAFFWTVLTNKEERRILLKSGWKDISKIFGIAVILDSVYQLAVIRSFSLLQTLLVAFCVAVVPYVVLRGPASRIMRGMNAARGLTPAPKR